ncbi:Glutamate receptor 3.1 [Vitis vinifera]|uniref:Glutamate receptor 3.1 n=1 Tax=Vitis vinifera TaxID=29760 RepID=A0A438J4Q9_VITVI|nr:Glutamate receptor 3.1 [Vitis vinifera]
MATILLLPGAASEVGTGHMAVLVSSSIIVRLSLRSGQQIAGRSLLEPPEKHLQMKAVAAIIGSWGWRRINVIYEDTNSAGSEIIPFLADALKQVGSEIGYLAALHHHLQQHHKSCTSMNSSVISSMEGRQHEPGIFAVQAYDAVWSVALAMDNNGSTQQLLEKIELSDFHGLTNRIKFERRRLAPQRMFQIVNVIGKSNRELGFWSEGSGFAKPTNGQIQNSSSMDILGQVFWPGGPTSTPRGWAFPTSETPLRIGVPLNATFKQFFLFISSGRRYVDSFKEMGSGEFSHPYTEPGLMMIVPEKVETSNRAWLFMKPFTKDVGSNRCYNHLQWLHPLVDRTKPKPRTYDRLYSEPNGNLGLPILHHPLLYACKRSFAVRYLVDVIGIKMRNIKDITSADQYARDLRSGEIAAAFIEAPYAKIFLAQNCKGFAASGKTYKVGVFGFVFPKGSPILPDISKAVLEVTENGELRELQNMLIGSQKCNSNITETSEDSSSLSPSSFWVLFLITGGVSTVCLVIFMARERLTYLYNYSLGHMAIWRLISAVMRSWRSHPRERFSRGISDEESNGNGQHTSMHSPQYFGYRVPWQRNYSSRSSS